MRSAIVALSLALILTGCSAGATPTPDPTTPTAPATSPTAAEGLVLDPTANYGDRYADGILPVGDEHFTLTTPEVGQVYLCEDRFVPDGQAGAQTRGPWFVNDNTEWDLNAKPAVAGSVTWDNQLSVTVAGGIRTIVTNDLPDHHTGEFPVAQTDPVRQFDANPNSISAQSLTYSLAADPTYGDPQCMGGEVGVMLTGVALFNGFDAGGRDAGAWEVQDDCGGHPERQGEYHYHTLSTCITDLSVTDVIGWALDGFPITGPKLADGNILTTVDLDECHGIVSDVTLDGATVSTYHYVMTQDFPYSASCFRASPINPPRS